MTFRTFWNELLAYPTISPTAWPTSWAACPTSWTACTTLWTACSTACPTLWAACSILWTTEPSHKRLSSCASLRFFSEDCSPGSETKSDWQWHAQLYNSQISEKCPVGVLVQGKFLFMREFILHSVYFSRRCPPELLPSTPTPSQCLSGQIENKRLLFLLCPESLLAANDLNSLHTNLRE